MAKENNLLKYIDTIMCPTVYHKQINIQKKVNTKSSFQLDKI